MFWRSQPLTKSSPGANLGEVQPDQVVENDGGYRTDPNSPFPFASIDGAIFDTGDLSGDLFPGPVNAPGVPERTVYWSQANAPFGVPVGQPYQSPIQFREERVVHVQTWQAKMDDNAAPNGFAHGTWDGDSPLQGLYVPPIGQYVLPNRAQSLYVGPGWAAANPNAGARIPPVLSPAWNE